MRLTFGGTQSTGTSNKRVKFIVVNSNSNESFDEVRTYAKEVGFDFPVYKDVITR
jgi:hypothetical protein